MPGTSASRSALIRWQVDVPMTTSSWPGSIALAAGEVTWASMLPTATAIPSGRPVQPAASAVSDPARSPSWDEGMVELVRDEVRRSPR